jgi:glycosyltransferase involved in cell wall biosynthesis
LKVLHVPFSYAPDPVGGTEIYVERLAQALRRRGVDSVIAAPGGSSRYEHRGSPVFRFSTSDGLTLEELYGMGDPLAAQELASILEEQQPDVVHLHAYTSAVGIRSVAACHARGIPVVFTFHTPSVTCGRGSLMKWGRTACSGVLDPAECVPCLYQSKGVPAGSMSRAARALSRLAAHFPGAARRQLPTALRLEELTAIRKKCLAQFIRAVDQLVVPCLWARDVVLANGFRTDAVVSPHGIDPIASPEVRHESGPVRILFAGRLHSEKGVGRLLEALILAPNADVQIDVYGIVQTASEHLFADQLRQFSSRDRRLRVRDVIPNEELVGVMRDYDAVAVPSQWFETGPMVVLEAFTAGVPVIGSRMPAITEKVRDQIDGILVDPFDAQAWAAVFNNVSKERLARLGAAIGAVRSMDDVAAEHTAIYHETIRRGVQAA